MEGYWVYGLSDPRTGELRYVGKTTWGRHRLRQHIAEARGGRHNTKKNAWLCHLLKVGLEPEIQVLETGDTEDALLAAEAFWIGSLRLAGADLLNHTDGGERGVSGPRSAETRAKMSAAKKGKRVSAKTLAARQAGGLARRGVPLTQGHRDALSRGRLGMKFSDEHRASIAATHGGSPIRVVRLADGWSTICYSQTMAAEAAGTSRSAVCKVLSGRNKVARGHTFEKVTQ